MSDNMAESLRVLGNWFAKQELVEPGAICLTAADRLDAAIAHIDALEARVARLEGALHEIQFGELQCDYCQENMRVARAALAEVKP